MRWMLFACAALLAFSLSDKTALAESAERLFIELKGGVVEIELMPNLAPKHVEQVKELTSKGFYNGLSFHRVIEGFMAQTGDPTGTGNGGSSMPNLKAEFSDYPFDRGVVGMARAGHPDSANSQFFICFSRADWLDGEYTVIGRVTKGMELVDQIAKGDPRTGAVNQPDKIIKMGLAQ